jgi:prepilin-type N-terminal cleavage/methylation domain-containing protein/prepilin-type processing-associated H-X9-DG protein
VHKRARTGFTLIELLVVIAIIAILAAMLFPVFARARESARKIQCLSNVKNIATAIQMYLTDYDRFPPSEHRQQALEDNHNWIEQDRGCAPGSNYRATWEHPYLRWPVIFDEYVKNREVWSCPSAKWDPVSLWIVPGYMGDYLKYLEATHGQWVVHGWSPGGDPCAALAYPPGWGGDVTDSIGEQIPHVNPGSHPGCFDPTIGYVHLLVDLRTSQIGDAARCVVCGDATNSFGATIQNPGSMLYECCDQGCGNGSYYSCTDSQVCSFPVSDLSKWQNDPGYREKYTRHLGGSNVGFGDGHASWFKADALVAQSPYTATINGVCTPVNVDANGQPLLFGFCPNPLFE